MKIKLTHKIFAASLVTAFVGIFLMILCMGYFINRYFNDYVNTVELRRFSKIKTRLIQEYSNNRDWSSVNSNRAFWSIVANPTRPVQTKPSPDFFRGSQPRLLNDMPEINNPVTPHGPGGQERMTPLGRGPVASIHIKARVKVPNRQKVFLLDSQKNLVAGDIVPEAKQILQEIMVQGKLAGWLGLEKRPSLITPVEKAFLSQLFEIYFLTGLGIVVISTIISFFLSKHLLSPIKRITKGTREIASRNFETRIKVNSGDELGQLANDFNSMAQTIENYEKMRLQWISDISHELRTPLAVLRSEIEAVQDGIRSYNSDSLNSFHTEVMHLGNLVDDLHLLSLADSGELSLCMNNIKPVEILKNTLRSFSTRLNKQEITVTQNFSEFHNTEITGDKNKITRLFVNLIENTIRYTDSPGTLNVYTKKSGDFLSLFFEDSSPGVPENSLEKLFDRLYRADRARTRTSGGSGLGLSICRQIVEGHSGHISAYHSQTGGLLVKVDLPLKSSRGSGYNNHP